MSDALPPFGVVFDLDGLLVDSERVQAIAFNVVLARYGIELDDAAFAQLVGTCTWQNFVDLKLAYPQIAEDVADIIARKDGVYADLVPREMTAMPGAVTLVRALAAHGVPMAVASSSGREDIVASLRAVGLDRSLTRLASGVEVPRSKPAPDVYLAALDLLGLPASACVALEDAGPGVEAATAAGLACVAVPNRFTRGRHDFTRAAAVVDSLEQVTPAMLARTVGACAG